MKALRAAATALLGLFVDDGTLALLVLFWLALIGLAVIRSLLSARWSPGLLFGGVAAILILSAWRRSRRR